MERNSISLVREKQSFYRDSNRIFLIFFISILMSICICIIGSKSAWMDILTLVCYAGPALAIWAVASDLILKYFYFWVCSTWSILAVFLYENGNVYLRGNHSEHIGSLPVYVLSWIVFYACIIGLDFRNNKRHLLRTENYFLEADDKNQIYVSDTIMWISYLFLFLLIVCFAAIIRKPYFLLGIDRFEYRETQISEWIGALSPWFNCFIPVVLMSRHRNKVLPIAYISIFALFLIWQGEKFSGLFSILFYVILSVSPEYAMRVFKQNSRKILKIAFAMVFALLVIVTLHEVMLYQSDIGMLVSYFENRIAAQGELWWLTYKQDAHMGTHWREIGDEVTIWIHQPEGIMAHYDFGIYKMMKNFMDPGWVAYALGMNIRATESTRASLFYYGKTPLLIIGQMLLGLLVYYSVNFCTKYCSRGKWFLAVLSIYILQNVIAAVFMSDFQLLTSKRMLLVYILFIFFSHVKVSIRSNV